MGAPATAIAAPMTSASAMTGLSVSNNAPRPVLQCSTHRRCTLAGGDCSLRVCPMASAFVDTPRGDLNHDGKIGYLAKAFSAGAATKDVDLGYSKVQWSRYLQFESWPTIAQTGTADIKTGTGGVVTPDGSTATNVVGGWKAQKGEAHFVMECAGKGTCDRAVGVCRCYEGYSGSACQRGE